MRALKLSLIALLFCGCQTTTNRVHTARRTSDTDMSLSRSETADSSRQTRPANPTSGEPVSRSDSDRAVAAPSEKEPPRELFAPRDAGDRAPAIHLASAALQTGDTTAPDIDLDDVIDSVHRSYPLVQAAWLQQQVADGSQLAAWGDFDTKLKAEGRNTPLGFYETYRNSAGVYVPRYDGGEYFAAYRNGGGNFEPWYQERETNDGGEFKAGARIPLLRNRNIDARRAELWRRTYDRQLARPQIRQQLIDFSAAASYAYWKWVAAGHKYRLGQQWLDLAAERNDSIAERVRLQDLDPPEQLDNERAIAKRAAKLAESRRVLDQAAQKLSLFLRDASGQPFAPELDQLPPFPKLREFQDDQLEPAIRQARQNRPELNALSLKLRQLQVDYAEAHNSTQAQLDAQLIGSQDVGEPTSSKRDKSPFELEAGVFFELPVERRKGRGKMHAVQAKMAQVSAKRRLVQDKITAEVRSAEIGLRRSREAVEQASRAASLATTLAEQEVIKFQEGGSDLLKVALREQYALEAAEDVISAQLGHFAALADYNRVLGLPRPDIDTLPAVMPDEEEGESEL